MAAVRTNVYKAFNQSFALDKNKLSRIVNIIEQRYTEIGITPISTYRVLLKNGKIIQVTTPDELLQLDNIVKNPVRNLQISYVDQQNAPQHSLTLNFGGTAHDIELRVLGSERKWADQFFAEVEEQIERLFTGNIFSVFSRRNASLIFPIFASIIFTLATIVLSIFFPSPTSRERLSLEQINTLLELSEQAKTEQEKLDVVFQILTKQLEKARDSQTAFNFASLLDYRFFFLALPLIIIVACIIYLAAYCYPRQAFLWGDYENHYTSLLSRRTMLWGTIILSIVLGVVTNLFVIGLSGFFRL
jgi:hypothetical protein